MSTTLNRRALVASLASTASISVVAPAIAAPVTGPELEGRGALPPRPYR